MESKTDLTHLGLVVHDMKKTVAYYESLGIGVSVGPQPPRPASDSRPAAERPKVTTLIYGEPVEIDWSKPVEEKGLSEGNVQIGDLQLEVLHSHPSSFQWRYSERTCEGISHICFNVPDILDRTAKLTEKGLQIVFSIEGDGWIGENYLDTSRLGGVWFSMRPPKDSWFRKWEEERMAKEGVNDWKFRGVGIAVQDLEKTAKYYQSLGIADLQPEVAFDSSTVRDLKVDGASADRVIKARTQVADMGPMAYEFVQPLEGETIYRNALERRGDGINDIVFAVADIEKETAELVQRGVSVVLSGKPQNGSPFAYFGTLENGGHIMLKLVQAD